MRNPYIPRATAINALNENFSLPVMSAITAIATQRSNEI
jgi:hypothetical protein